MRRIWQLMTSLETGLALLLALCIAMAAGSFLLAGEAAASINAMPLFAWLLEVPASWSWWLWLSLAVLALLAVNTLLCSLETVQARWRRAGLLPLAAPQLIHAGFLMILLAHGISAVGASHTQHEVFEGSVARFPGGQQFGVAAISVAHAPSGMPTGFSGELVPNLSNPAERVTVSPNRPWFSYGHGVYIKQAAEFPYRRALLEIHREPGAGMALAGSLLFAAGCAVLLWLRGTSRGAGSAGGRV